MRALLVGILCLLVAPSAAHAYYVDISITGAGRVYETTDANELDEHCPDSIEGFASPSTTPTGTFGASCRAGAADGDYGWGWTVRYVAEAASGYRFDGWHSDGRTTPGPVLCDGSGGSSDYGEPACQFATHADLQVRARFVDDTAPAMSSLTGPNQVVNGPATFNFSAGADATLSHFECRIGGVHEWQTCSSGYAPNLNTGTYTLQVRAADRSGNRSTESTWTWTVDKVAPITSVTGGPANGSRTTSTSASFSLGMNEPGSIQCKLDGPGGPGTFAPCGSPRAYNFLSNGTYTFSARAVDTPGNVGPTVTRTWTVDTVGPTTSIGSGPANGSRTTSTSASFGLTSTEPGSFQCKLDGPGGPGTFGACDSTPDYTGLGDGAYTFTARALDDLGNVGSSVTRSWTVDTTPPNTSITGGPEGATPSNSPTFTFTSSEPGSAFECKLDSGAWEPCNSGTKGYTSLADGEHNFHVRAKDALNLVDASEAVRTWTIDTVRPDTSITGGPTGDTTSTSASFQFSASEAGTTFECKLDAGAWESCTSGKSYSGLGLGSHTFLVRATDAAGNLDLSEAVRSWTVTQPAGGDPPGGDPPGGDPPGGDPSGGDPSGGDPSGGDPSGGNPSGGDPVVTPDTTKPFAVLSVSKSQRLARVLTKGLVGSGASNELGKLRLDVFRGRKLVATSGERALGAPGQMKLTAKFTRNGKRALAGLRSVKLTLRLTAADAAGNATVTKKTLTLKR